MSNKTTTIRVNSCPDSTVTLNGNPFLSVASGGSVASEVRDQNNDLVPATVSGANIIINRFDEIDLYMNAIGSTNALWRGYLREHKEDLIAAGVWDKAIALNPVMGGTASTHAEYLLGRGFGQMLFFGGVTHDANGMVGNGSNGYYNTGIALGNLQQNNHSVFVYSRTNIEANTHDLSVLDSGFVGVSNLFRAIGNTYNTRSFASTNQFISNNDSRGVHGLSRTNSANYLVQIRTTQTTVTQASATPSNLNIQIAGMALNANGTIGNFSTRQQSYVWLGRGLTATQMADLEIAIVKLQTQLARNV
jgi:hypothetical protein